MLEQLWYRFDAWLWDTTGVTRSTVIDTVVIAAVFGYLWHASR